MHIIALRPEEAALSEIHRLVGLQPDAKRMDTVLGGALTSLLTLVADLGAAHMNGEPLRVCALADEIADEASRFGLQRMARVAMTVSELAVHDDRPAYAATVVRLARLGSDARVEIARLRHLVG